MRSVFSVCLRHPRSCGYLVSPPRSARRPFQQAVGYLAGAFDTAQAFLGLATPDRPDDWLQGGMSALFAIGGLSIHQHRWVTIKVVRLPSRSRHRCCSSQSADTDIVLLTVSCRWSVHTTPYSTRWSCSLGQAHSSRCVCCITSTFLLSAVLP